MEKTIQVQKSRNHWLDLFRFLLVFMVVGIHFWPNSALLPIFRFAVPMFFMISGYFAYSPKYDKQNEKNKRAVHGCLKYLVIGCAIYFVVDIFSIFVGLCTGQTGTVIQSFIVYGGLAETVQPLSYGYHLWFLLSLFIVSIIHYFVCKHQKDYIYKYLIPILIVMALFLNGYSQFLGLSLPVELTRNSIFTGLPLFAIGYLLHKNGGGRIATKKSKILILSLSILLLSLSLFEAKIVVMEYYISSVLAAIGFLIFFTSLNVKETKFQNWFYKYVGKDSAFYIYIIHILVGVLLSTLQIPGEVLWICVFVLSFVIYEIVFLILKKIKPFNKKTT